MMRPSPSSSSLNLKQWSSQLFAGNPLSSFPGNGNSNSLCTATSDGINTAAAKTPAMSHCTYILRKEFAIYADEAGNLRGQRNWSGLSTWQKKNAKRFRNLREKGSTYGIDSAVRVTSHADDKDFRERSPRSDFQKLGLSLTTLTATALFMNLSPVSSPTFEEIRQRESSRHTPEHVTHKSYFQVELWNALRVGPAHANGLLRLPPEELKNTYYLVRAGESEKESQGILYTNPVGKTSMDSGLSAKGKLQTLAAARELKRIGACEDSCWVWPSITQRAYQTAEIISAVNQVPYSRIVPEYSFLDARSVGAFEGKGLDALDEVHALDATSQRLRPPPFYDGTPNESVADVLVRVVQLMSILETQYFGDTVIIVSPDSDNLSVLHAALLGLDLRSHTTLGFAPGEVRMVDLTDKQGPTPNFSGYIACPKPPSCN